jgi:hypothetical protein
MGFEFESITLQYLHRTIQRDVSLKFWEIGVYHQYE